MRGREHCDGRGGAEGGGEACPDHAEYGVVSWLYRKYRLWVSLQRAQALRGGAKISKFVRSACGTSSALLFFLHAKCLGLSASSYSDQSSFHQ